MDIRQKIECAISNAKASLEVEGGHLSPAAEDLIRRMLGGQLSDSEFLRIALELAKSLQD